MVLTSALKSSGRARLGRPSASGVLMALAYAYLFLPFLLFVLGWLKLYIALPLAVLVVVCYVRMAKNAPTVWTPQLTLKDWKSLVRLCLILVLVLVWVYYSGIGRFTHQTEDHNVRNAIFRMLVEEPWPLVDMNPPAAYFSGPVAFVYYFGFWLPAAVVGKAFGLFAGNVAQLLWAAGGVLLFYFLVLAKLQKWRVWPLVVFIFFSGMDWVAASIFRGGLINVITATPHLDNWPDYFQFTSFSAQLYWVFNQSIMGWLATLLLVVQKNNRAMAPIIAFALITGTIPAVGLVPLCLYFVCSNWHRQHKGQPFNIVAFIKDLLSFENIVGLFCGVLAYLFLGTNNAGQRFSTLFHLAGDIWWLWLLFVACEALVLLALVAKYQYKNPLFYLITGLFLLLPWLRLGEKADLCMRGTIPSLVILYLMVVCALDKSFAQKSWGLFAGLCAALLVGSATAETEIIHAVAYTRLYRQEGRAVADIEWHPMELDWRDNFYGHMEGKFFFKYLMKTPPAPEEPPAKKEPAVNPAGP